MNDWNVIIVTRHKPLVEWLKAHGITGRIIERATVDDVRDKDVYGILPLHLAAYAASVTEVSMPDLTLEQRKKNAAGDLTIDEMNEAGAHLERFIVFRRDKVGKHESKEIEAIE